jgi:hypothetical protein
MDFREVGWGWGLVDPVGSGWGPMAVSCKYGDGPVGSVAIELVSNFHLHLSLMVALIRNSQPVGY